MIDLKFFASAVSAMDTEELSEYWAVIELEVMSRVDGFKECIPARERHKKAILKERELKR